MTSRSLIQRSCALLGLVALSAILFYIGKGHTLMVDTNAVTIDGKVKGAIGRGLVVLLGVLDADAAEDIEWLSGKISRLRIFNDRDGVMNLSVCDIGGEILLISQFTLFASTKKGNRPSYIAAAAPPIAIPLYEQFIQRMTADIGKPPATGEFGADMKVALVNDGPVTILIDSKNRE